MKETLLNSQKQEGSLLKQVTKVINRLNASLLAIFLVIFLTWLLLLGTSKYDGGQIFKVFFYDPFNSLTRMKKILNIFAPFLIGAVAVWICLKIGLVNLGVGGQMSFAALSIYFSLYFLKKTSLFTETETPLLWLPLLFLIGIVAATFLSLLCGVLKVFFNVNEVLATIFTNYIVFYFFRYFVSLDKIVDAKTKLRTAVAAGDSIAFNFFAGLIPLTLFLALFLYGLLFFLFQKTKIGFQFRVVGYGPRTAKYAGISMTKISLLVFLISGILAGMAGIFYYYRDPDNTFLYKSEALPNNGFDTISIVWLSQSSIYAIPFVSFFVALIRTQQKVIKISSVDPVVVEIIIGFMILFVAFFTYLPHYGKLYQKRWFLHLRSYLTSPQLLVVNCRQQLILFKERWFGIKELNKVKKELNSSPQTRKNKQFLSVFSQSKTKEKNNKEK